MKNNLKTGAAGEVVVEKYLIDKGFSIIAKNFNCRLGEIDIIAKKDNVLSFVEVKTRKSDYFAISSVVVPSKQRKIISTAKLFLLKNPKFLDFVCRFDVATVLDKDFQISINYIEDAFRENF